MKKLMSFIFVFIISFEFLSILIALFLAFFWPTPLAYVVENLNLTDESLKYLSFVPLGLGVWSINQSRKLLFPDHEKKQVLHEWPDYWKLKVRFNVSFIYACIFTFTGLSCWLLKFTAQNPLHLAILSFSILGAVSLAVSIYWARVSLDEILIKIRH